MTATFRRLKSGWLGRVLSLGLACWWLASPLASGRACAQTATRNSSAAQTTSDPVVSGLDEAGMALELQRLDAICAKLGLTDEQHLMRRWTAQPMGDADRFYLPIDRDPRASGIKRNPDGEAKHANWLRYFSTARQRHAQYWYEQAQQKSAAGDEWGAYKLLWRAAREDETHAPVKRALGPLLTALNTKSRPKTITAVHPQLQWPSGSYSRVDTPNFRLTSRADANTTLAIADQLEQFFALWTQIFYPLWAPPNLTTARLSGRNTPWNSKNQFQIVLCKDRADYLKTLGVSEANIGVSVGYYNPDVKMSFFYPDDQLSATLFHELTHQLLAEGSQLKRNSDVGSKGDFWIVEGIALHMESLRPVGLDWELGGWLAPRLQTARYRSLHDGYWIGWPELTDAGLEEWKSNPEIAKFYSHAAGLSHYFLDPRLPEHGQEQDREKPAELDSMAAHSAYFMALVGVYQGDRGATNKLLDILGNDQAQRNYVNHLLVRDRHVATLANYDEEALASNHDLVLTRSQLSPESWLLVGRLKQLRWLDCSFSNITPQDIKWMDQLKQLERLSLEGTAADASVIALVARLPRLKELDLSQCTNVDDTAIASLAGHASLETLWLSQTKISLASKGAIESIPRLSFVDLGGTAIDKENAESISKRIGGRKSGRQ